MLFTCWSVKGGSGVSVVSAALAGLMVQRHGAALLVDLGGDQPAVLGLADQAGAGVLDWCDSDAPPEALDRLTVEVTEGLRLLPRGEGSDCLDAGRGAELVAALSVMAPAVIVDAGIPLTVASPSAAPLQDPAPDGRAHGECLRAAGTSLFVTRACYLSLRRAVRMKVAADGVILISEPGRALASRDVSDVLGLPVLGVVEADPAVARAVDSGTLVRRLPASLSRGLRRAG